MKYYSIYDKVADDYAPLFAARSDGDALRIFKSAFVNNKDKFVTKDDYALWYVLEISDKLDVRKAEPHLVLDLKELDIEE